MMNYVDQMQGFFEKMNADPRLSPFHIALYTALFQQWNKNFFRNPNSISRTKTMKLAKIGSTTTYSRCLQQLHRYGYINYKPSHNPQKGSLVYMHPFTQSTTKTNRADHVLPATAQKTSVKNNPQNHEKTQLKTKNSNTEPRSVKDALEIPPLLQHVKIYFLQKNFSAIEAEKFFNHFQSNGWLVGGRSKMKDWKAAARNWMLNVKKFQNNEKSKTKLQPGRLGIEKSNGYAEPL